MEKRINNPTTKNIWLTNFCCLCCSGVTKTKKLKKRLKKNYFSFFFFFCYNSCFAQVHDYFVLQIGLETFQTQTQILLLQH